MPGSNTNQRVHRKRQGKHQKRTSHFLKVYSPYLPLALFIGLSLFITAGWRPHTGRPGVLAYATDMSVSGLLSATNQQRSANGSASLGSNSALNSAAQAKANDMVARNYWSHNTPEGNAPWTFITNAGYNYSSAGENLAYGFETSSSTVTGWMNSPSHKENLLSTNFTEVGFGFANGANFNSSGAQTVVVAMYGKPAGSAQPATPAPAPAKAPSTTTTNKPTPVAAKPVETPSELSEQGKKVLVTVLNDDGKPIVGTTVTLFSEPRTAVTDEHGVATFTNVETGEHTAKIEVLGVVTEKSITVAENQPEIKVTVERANIPPNTTPVSQSSAPAPVQQPVSRFEIITKGVMPWATGLLFILTISVAMFLTGKHAKKLHKLIARGERYVLHHALFDLTLVSLAWLCIVLSRSVGIIL